jgi:hypothetical protein
MSLSVADIDKWNPESLSAVGTASAARANAAAQASSRLAGLSAFNHWEGAGAGAAQARTQALADGLDQHGQAASTVATAANTAANEVRQIKNQLSELRTTVGQYGIIIDADGSRVVPPSLSSLSAANRNLVQDMVTIGHPPRSGDEGQGRGRFQSGYAVRSLGGLCRRPSAGGHCRSHHWHRRAHADGRSGHADENVVDATKGIGREALRVRSQARVCPHP